MLKFKNFAKSLSRVRKCNYNTTISAEQKVVEETIMLNLGTLYSRDPYEEKLEELTGPMKIRQLILAPLNLKIYKMFIDPTFDDVNTFLNGSKQVVQTLRPLLYNNDLTNLEPLLTERCFQRVQNFASDILIPQNFEVQGELIKIEEPLIVSISTRFKDDKIETLIAVQV